MSGLLRAIYGFESRQVFAREPGATADLAARRRVY